MNLRVIMQLFRVINHSEKLGYFYKKFAYLPTIVDRKIIWLKYFYSSRVMLERGGYGFIKISEEEYTFLKLSGKDIISPWQ
jgi:hypothetical protein